MAATTITDLIIPQIWSAYAQENLAVHGIIQSAGVVEVNNSPDVIGGDEYTREPKFKPLTSTGASERIVPATNVTLANMEAYAEYGVIARRAKGWSQEDLAEITSGADPMQSGMTQFTEYWAREIETVAVQVVNAAFDATNGPLRTTHRVDQSANSLAISYINDTKFLLGEAYNVFDKIFVSSTHMASLDQLGIVDYVDAGRFGERVLVTGAVPMIMGMMTVVNDTLCATVGGGVYPIYIMGGQPLRFSYQRPIRMETDRNIQLAAGTDYAVSSVHVAPHIKGMSYSSSGTPTATTNPTNANLATATNWEKVATNDDAIRICQLLALA